MQEKQWVHFMFIMNEGGETKLLQSKFTLGGDTSVAGVRPSKAAERFMALLKKYSAHEHTTATGSGQ